MALKNLFAFDENRLTRDAKKAAAAVSAHEPSLKALSGDELRAKTAEFRDRLARGESPDALLPEAFAAVREAAVRTVGMRHFDVQIMGGYVLYKHAIAEMKTGEGKTLVATLPVYLNALMGKGVHVVTVNDYLARRDAVWMGQVYAALGLSVGIINHDASYIYDAGHQETDDARDELGSFKVFYEFLRPSTRKEAYLADITYGTNSEFGFDYLRDNIAYNPEELRQRGHAFAIVDEVDSILIDEARTPLIISAPAQEAEDFYKRFAVLAAGLREGEHYSVDEKHRSIQLTDLGIEEAERQLGIENIYTDRGIKYVHHLETAVRAKALYHANKQYVVKGGEVVIVDEFTGRLQPGRRWSEGLHQAIEAKEGVAIQKESRTYASVTYQNYFRMYERLAGMTGTALTSKEEFYKVYRLDTVEVPTNRPQARIDREDLIFQTEDGKFRALSRTVKGLHEKGQPVLIGTASIEKNELLSAYLTKEGIPHEVLNAKNHERESEIIAQAGKKGKVTVATNLAGRGVDIKLGGNPATPEEYEEIKSLGGLFVIGTERHEARRIDNQLRGRSGRQGDPGETQFYVSLEDDLMRVFASDAIKRMMGSFGIPEDEPIANRMISRALESAQTKIEGFHFDSRKHVLEFDDVLNKQRAAIYDKRRTILTGTADEVRTLIQSYAQGREDALSAMAELEREAGEGAYLAAVRRIALQTIDLFWLEHLEAMEYMRGSVNLRAYGQRDPLIEYRKEGLRLFRTMEEAVAGNTIELIMRAGVSDAPQASVFISAGTDEAPSVGRNDPCPCGSGKKWKNCGLPNTEEHQRLMAAKR
jgi:preprotein translocase subunit SecA